MRIPQSVIDHIRRISDIVDIIEQYVKLKPRGKNFVGLCPFHQEKTPSFTVSPEKQMFYCFGCQTGGDVFTFLKLHEKISYPEAIRLLAERYHIPVPQEKAADEAERTLYDELYQIHQVVGEFYRHQLHRPEGRIALEYLRHRGFSPETVEKFQIGYAPDRWDALAVFAREQGLSTDILQKAGLLIARGDGSFYDRFRHRLMFPIHNPSGRIIAFGGRQLRDDPESPKYLNSPETPIYQKSQVLYGLPQAREDIIRKDTILITEGYADCITLHEYGFRHTCASLGTAFTTEQCQLLRRYTTNVILLFDSDEAGLRAAERAGSILLEQGLNIRIVTIPDGKDPDGFLRLHGAEAMEALLKKAAGYMDFRVQQFIRRNAFQTVHDRATAAHELLQVIAGIQDPIQQNLYLREMIRHFELSENTLSQELQKIIRRRRLRDASSAPKTSINKPPIPEAIRKAERFLLRLMLTEPVSAETVFRYLSPSDFQVEGIRLIVEMIADRLAQQQPISPEELMVYADEPLRKSLTRLLIEAPDDFSLNDCLSMIQIHHLQKKMEDLRYTIKLAEEQGEDIRYYQQLWYEGLIRLKTLKEKREPISLHHPEESSNHSAETSEPSSVLPADEVPF